MSQVEVSLYYADWCGHCQRFKPEWNKLKPLIKEKYGGSCKEYEQKTDPEIMKTKDIKGFPTIVVRIGDREMEYEGKRDMDQILNFIDRQLNGCGQTGGGMSNSYYKLKYLKYKAKYMKLKML